MNEFIIVGKSKPNKIKLQTAQNSKTTELSERKVRMMVDSGMIKLQNPEKLYHPI